MRKNILIVTLCACAGVFASAAEAAPSRWAGNGHYYDFVLGAVGWESALAGAADLAPLRDGRFSPYLATITSAEENAFVAGVMAGNRGWLGGSDRAAEGVWRWVAGPETGSIFFGTGAAAGAYTNWNTNEPNNVGNEDGLEIRPDGTVPYRWNDLPLGDTRPNGYVVEWSPAAGVPEPTTWALMIGGFGLAGAMRRRQRSSFAAIKA